MRRFPPPWMIEGHTESFIVKDATGQALGLFLFRPCTAVAAVAIVFMRGKIQTETLPRGQNARLTAIDGNTPDR